MSASKILLSRNRVKKQHKVYMHEATMNILAGLSDGSVSENVNAIVCSFLIRIGKDMKFLDKATINRINVLRRSITPCA